MKVARRKTLVAIWTRTIGSTRNSMTKEYGCDLGEGVRFAEDAGAEVAEAGNHEEHAADQENGDVAAENR